MVDAGTQLKQVTAAAAAAAALLGAALMLLQAGVEHQREAVRVQQLRSAIAALPSVAAQPNDRAQREAARVWSLVVEQVHPGTELTLASLNLLSQHTPPDVLIEHMSWDGERVLVQGQVRERLDVARLAVRWEALDALSDPRRSCQPRVLSNEAKAAGARSETSTGTSAGTSAETSAATGADARDFVIGWRCSKVGGAAAPADKGNVSDKASDRLGDKAGETSAESSAQWASVLQTPAVAAPLAGLLLIVLWRAAAGSGRPWPVLRWQSHLLQLQLHLQGSPGAPWPLPLRAVAVSLALGAGALLGSALGAAWLGGDGDEMALRSQYQSLLQATAKPADPEASAFAAVMARAMAVDRGDPLPGLQRQRNAAMLAGRLVAGQMTAGDETLKDYFGQRPVVLTLRGGFDASSRWLAQALGDPLRRLAVTRLDLQGLADGDVEWQLELSAIRPVSAEGAATRQRDAARGKTP